MEQFRLSLSTNLKECFLVVLMIKQSRLLFFHTLSLISFLFIFIIPLFVDLFLFAGLAVG